MTEYAICPSPLGPLWLVSDGAALSHCLFEAPAELTPAALSSDDGWRENPDAPLLQQARAQLGAYFAGARRDFDLPLAPTGTPFQLRVWQALRQIPYGQTLSYGALAQRLGQPKAARAVGLANGQNPLSVIVPCHRVIGASGALVGYGGGLERKLLLLRLEGRQLDLPMTTQAVAPRR